ncbi:Clp protease N-terminal domain-containing protein [Actinophytocola sp. KF-1]
MPKINVYLPDDLAESVKETGLPVSAICQRALEQSVKRVTAIRAVRDLTSADPTAALTSFTQRSKDVLTRAIVAAATRGSAEVGTRDLLQGMLEEGENLGVRILASVEIDAGALLRELRAEPAPQPAEVTRIGTTAANALELTVVEALTMGHNYVGCEHLLLGLLAEPDGTAGQALRERGAESRQVRQVVSAALAGYVHLRANEGGAAALTAAVGKALEPVLRRLDRLEENAGLR